MFGLLKDELTNFDRSLFGQIGFRKIQPIQTLFQHKKAQMHRL